MARIVVEGVGMQEQVLSGERVISIAPHDRGVTDLALALSMLLVEVIDHVELTSTSNSLHVVLTHNQGAPKNSLLGVGKRGHGLALELSTNHVELCLAFLLRYVRDGFGEVDHLDLEGTSKGEQAVTVILRVPSARAPMSPEEAHRLMGA